MDISSRSNPQFVVDGQETRERLRPEGNSQFVIKIPHSICVTKRFNCIYIEKPARIMLIYTDLHWPIFIYFSEGAEGEGWAILTLVPAEDKQSAIP